MVAPTAAAPADVPRADVPHADLALPAALREREYSPSSCIGGNYQPFIDAYAQRSQAARLQAQQAGARWLQVPYGNLPSQTMQLCLPPAKQPQPAAGAGLLVFIHGGYWQELSAQQSLFGAAHAVNQGLAYCALDYTLAPQARVGGIVAECRQALQTLAAGAATWGLDARRIVVAGSSAGAHLAAMVCLPQWQGGAPRAFTPLAAVLVSGIYQLQPLLGTSINTALAMDDAEALACSPLQHPLLGFPRTHLAWGSVETAAFKRQSLACAERLVAAGTHCSTGEIEGRNHFDVALDIADPATALGRATLGLFKAL